MENFEPNQNYQYIRERMKERPVNRKKLMRRSIITAMMAVIFGSLACFTFLLLEPVISNFLHPEEEPAPIEIPQEVEEMLPEDMLITEEPVSPPVVQQQEQRPQLGVKDYEKLYNNIYDVAQETMKSVVTVTGISQDVDWFNNPYESTGQTSGLIIAESGREWYILTDASVLTGVEDVNITFSDGEVVAATLKQQDKNTGLAIVTVALNDIPAETKSIAQVAKLGSSRPSSLLASQVIALGRPYGSTESVAYGMITSKGTALNMADCNYELITTDIYGSENANGVLVNFSGEVIGIINQSYNRSEVKNLISAVGITELKKTIERMSNGKEAAYLGIEGVDVTPDVNSELGVPMGAYVTGIAMYSPAMMVGIQSGDVIVKINDTDISSFSKYTEVMMGFAPDDLITVVVKRQGAGEYREIEIPVVLGKN